MTRLLLLRHGESRSNREGRFSSFATCGGLTERGRAEAVALRERLAGERPAQPDLIFSSTMARAVQTADVVAEPTGIGVVRLVELAERQPGECEGMTRAAYEQRYGRVPNESGAEPFSPGGETTA